MLSRMQRTQCAGAVLSPQPARARITLAHPWPPWPLDPPLHPLVSQVSKEVIDKLYETAKQNGITLVSIAHDKSLAEHHDYVLDIEGGGGWTFGPRAR